MATYLDGMDGGKHNSDNTETTITPKTFRVSIVFDCIDAKNPLDAAKKIAKWLEEDAKVIYDVVDETTREAVSVDLSEDDEFAILPNKNN